VPFIAEWKTQVCCSEVQSALFSAQVPVAHKSALIPYEAEYEMYLPFGSLWGDWLRDVGEAVEKLKTAKKER
jgi:hypothetical protein